MSARPAVPMSARATAPLSARPAVPGSATAVDEPGTRSSDRPSSGGRLRVGCVILTTGERPDELAAALASVRVQRDVEVAVVVVLNADPDMARPDVGDATLLTPGRNLGIPEGRNLGAAALEDCDVALFLDDDGALVHTDTLLRAARAFERDPSLGVVTMRIVDPMTGLTERRHVPRLLVGDPNRSSWVTTFLGGACVVRLDAYRDAGGLPAEFVYAHEETSLAWRLLDRGYRIRYAGGLLMAHPALPPARHATYHFMTARNRVLLARKHLPALVGLVYVSAWTVLGLLRTPEGRRDALRGLLAGLRFPDVEREPISWHTVWRMTCYGRPPLL